jgi:hypothetical protein
VVEATKLTIEGNLPPGKVLSTAEQTAAGTEAVKATKEAVKERGALPGTKVNADVSVQDNAGNQVGETSKVRRSLSHGGNHLIIDVFISLPEGLSAADAAVAQLALDTSVAALPANIGTDPAFAGLVSVTGLTAADLVAAPPVANAQYQVAASPPPPCSMQCTQLMNGLSKKDTDMCFQYGTDSMGNTNPADLKCYPYGYNGCDSGMTHCNQKVCAAKDKKPSKCQKKLVDKGKLSKCSKRKWGRKKCKKTCCEAGY